MKTGIASYDGKNLDHIAFPLGGIGAGMICVQGTGALGNCSIRNAPSVNFEPDIFSAVYVSQSGKSAVRLIEGPVPGHKIFDGATGDDHGMGSGLSGKTYGLPRFKENSFEARFPFASLRFTDENMPLSVELTAFSPFIPLDADASSNPVASLIYTFRNGSKHPLEAAYYINALNFMSKLEGLNFSKAVQGGRVYKTESGFILNQPELADCPEAVGDFYVSIDDDNAKINADWFDGGWFDVLTMQWNDIKRGIIKTGRHGENKSPGGSIAVAFTLNSGEEKTITVKLAWYVPKTALRYGAELDGEAEKSKGKTHTPWYAAKSQSVHEVMSYFTENYSRLYKDTKEFSDALYQTTLPDVIMDAVTANLSILKSPTVLRQADGRAWAWEGCFDNEGSCAGSCTHVWNYAQAMPHLFPELERSLRQTEFNESQSDEGHQNFRASLPIRTSGHDFHAASDGQLGGIMKMYREWRIKGDDEWIASYWDKMLGSINYCIDTWDKAREGVLKEPHHNTYDIEFWGADSMCSSFYLGALKAITLIGQALGKRVDMYRELYEKGRRYMEERLFNGEYFIQETEWEALQAKLDLAKENEACVALVQKEGPKYQYGNGCLSDGVIGAWMAGVCGLGDILCREKVRSHLLSVYKYNFKKSLLEHDNPQRSGFALGNEGGLLLCTWPHGGKPSLPFIYSDEVWTGIEYQVASHLISIGCMEEGLEIVTALRSRYDGTLRNPFNEYECGNWYARALASYSLLQAMTGVRYDSVEKTLYISKKNMRSFTVLLCTDSGYGTVTLEDDGFVSTNIVFGTVEVNSIVFEED